MKQTVTFLCEAIAAALICLFCFWFLFRISGEHDYWDKIGEVAIAGQEQNTETEMAEQLGQIVYTTMPEIKVANRVYEIGEELQLSKVLLVKKEEDIWQTIAEQDEIQVELLNVWDNKGKVMTYEDLYLNQEAYPNWHGWRDMQESLCFPERGRYTLEVMITGENGRCNIIYCGLLVE